MSLQPAGPDGTGSGDGAAARWWDGFFDATYVDAWTEAGAFADTDEQAQRVAALLELPAGASVLDVPCGFGRIAAPLQARGYDVTGADLSADQLAVAAERNPGPRYVRADMRDPPPGPFDAVVNLYSSFGYFADPAEDRRALDAWFEVLGPGGVLLMELVHRDRVAHAYGQEPDPDAAVVEDGETDWRIGVREARVTYRGETRAFRVRLYTATELIAALTETGFVEVEARGGLAWGELTPETRLALRARKPATV